MERDTRRISYVNCTIIAINVIYFLYLEIAGSSENTAFMISKGAMYAPLVLEEGQMAAWGTHQELLETSPVYREICRSQMKREVQAV